jgi:small subunit ribosomal protein S6
MPLYELFAVAKPRLPKAQLADIMRAIGKTVMDQGGVVTDIKSYGDRRLAYDIRQPGARYSEVNAATLATVLWLPSEPCPRPVLATSG